MKYLKKLSWILLVSAAVLTGCTESNIVSPSPKAEVGDGQPDLDIDKNRSIDWEEVTSDVRDEYMEPYGPFADYVMDMAVSYDSDSKTVKVKLPVTHQTTPEIAALYGEEVLKTVGTSISIQNFYYQAPEEDKDQVYYGSYFDENDVQVQVFFYDQEGNEDTYLVNDTMKAKEQRALVPQA